MKQFILHGFKIFAPAIFLSLIAACNTTSPTPNPTPPTVLPTVSPDGTLRRAFPTPTPYGTLAAAFPTPAPQGILPAALPAFRIVGYITDWGVPVAPAQIEKLTHVNYAFALPKKDGAIDFPPNGWRLKQIVETAHAKNIRVLISVGGWGLDKQFEAFAASPELRAKFVKSLMQYIDENNLDGADLDWEYPLGGASSENFLALMKELRVQLDARKKLLTAAVAAYGDNAEGIPSETFALVDFLNLMAYAESGAHHSTYALAEKSLDYWNARGLVQEKTVLGIPFYASPGDVSFAKLVKSDANAAQTDFFNYHGTNVAYNGLPMMRSKTQLAMERANGVMIWSINDDATGDFSLLNAIVETTQGK